jgi:hypothetical protein
VLAAWPFLVTVFSGAEQGVVDSVWAAMTAGEPTLESVVASIPVKGAGASVSFSVVAFSSALGAPEADVREWKATVVARGAAAVDLLSIGGSRRFGSAGLQPWNLAEFDSVVGVTTGSLPPVPESTLRIPADAGTLERGVVRAQRALWSASGEFTTAVDASSISVAESQGEQMETGDTAERLDAADADTVISVRPEIREPAPEAAATTESVADYGDAAPDGERQPIFEVRIGDAEPRELLGALIVGRDPKPRRMPTSEPQTLVVVSSPTQQVSATHVEIARSGRTVVVTDLRSTNGTVVRIPGAAPVRLRQGDSIVTVTSAIVEIGDRNVIDISSRDREITGGTV